MNIHRPFIVSVVVHPMWPSCVQSSTLVRVGDSLPELEIDFLKHRGRF